MNTVRFEQLLNTYGGRPERWPAAESRELADFLQEHPEMSAALERETAFDDLLDQVPLQTINQARLKSLILQQTSRRQSITLLDRLLNWLLPEDPGALWRPALFAMVPLVMGVFVGMNIEQQETTDWESDIDIIALYEVPEYLDE